MGMQLSAEQRDWLTDFLARSAAGMRPEMAINTTGAAEPGATDRPGVMERMDASVNEFGRWVTGGGSRTGEPEAAPISVPAPTVPDMDRGQEKAEDVPIYWPPPASPAPEEPGLLERLDASVNDLGRWISGDGGHKAAPEAPPRPVPAAEVPDMDGGQERAEDVPIYWPPPAAPAPEEPGLLERLDASVNEFGRWVAGSAGHKDEPEPAPQPVAAPKVPTMDWGQEKAEDVPIYRPPPPAAPAPEEPGMMERMGNAVGSLFD